MPNQSNVNGSRGEGIAVGYLAKHGYDIICKNYTCKGGEVDIVAKINGCFVFVEVKSRKNLNYSTPACYVTKNKQKKVIYASKYFMFKADMDIYSTDMRFDVIEIIGDDSIGYKIRHIENAFTE